MTTIDTNTTETNKELKRLPVLTAKKLAKVTNGSFTYIFARFAYGDWAIEIPTKLVTKDTAKIEDLALTNPEDAKQLADNVRGFNKVIHHHCTYDHKDKVINITVNHSKKSKLSDLFQLERELIGYKKAVTQLGRFYSDRVFGQPDIQGAGYVNLRNLDTMSKYLPYGNYNIALPLENKLTSICINGSGGTSEDIRAVIMPIRIGG